MNDYCTLSAEYRKEAFRYVKCLRGATKIEKTTEKRISELREAENEDDVWELEDIVRQHRRCSFCGNRETDGRVLFVGKISSEVSICDECVREIIGRSENGSEEPSEQFQNQDEM